MTKYVPPQVIGIIGAGQLGYFMAIEALNMGYTVYTYDPKPDASAHRVSHAQFIQPFSDKEAMLEFGKLCDCVTYEFENVDLEVIKALESITAVPQGRALLYHSSHRYREWNYAKSLGIPVVPSVYIAKHSDVDLLHSLRFPVVLKTCRLGYDGKGQQKLASWEAIRISEPVLASEWIDYEAEISVLVVRSATECQTFPPICNKHKDGILDVSVAGLEVHYPQAIEYARRIAEDADYYGVMAVEFFIVEGQVIFNEIAPRPHNSGHYTLNGANKSQFRVHIEAITDHPIGTLYNHTYSVMVNILGQHLDKARIAALNTDTLYYYEYGKSDAAVNRKVGHATFIGKDAYEQAMKFREEIKDE